jgi:hypothetical protein
VVPEAGLAVPERRDGVCAGGHDGLAPQVAETASRVVMIARVSARRRAIASCPPGRCKSSLHRTAGPFRGTCTRSTPEYRACRQAPEGVASIAGTNSVPARRDHRPLGSRRLRRRRHRSARSLRRLGRRLTARSADPHRPFAPRCRAHRARLGRCGRRGGGPESLRSGGGRAGRPVPDTAQSAPHRRLAARNRPRGSAAHPGRHLDATRRTSIGPGDAIRPVRSAHVSVGDRRRAPIDPTIVGS